MIEVFANGKRFSNWTGVNIRRSLDNIAASFSLSLASSDQDAQTVGLFPGDSVEVSVNGEKAIKGYVDKLSTSFAAGSLDIRVSGSECSSDLADCCLESPLEWLKKDISAILRDICARFGLNFTNSMKVDVGDAFDRFAVDPGSRAIDSIQKLCRERGMLLCSDGLGNTRLMKPDACPRGDSLEQGVNLVSASVNLSLTDRYSKYTVHGTGIAKKKVSAESDDASVSRPRTLVIVDSNAVDKDKVQARADWEKNVRAAKSMSVSATVHGWNCSSGLWSPGVMCSFKASKLGIPDAVDLLVNSVAFSWSASSGEVTNLELVSPEVYTPQPESKKKKLAKKKSRDPWDAIAKAVKG